MIGCELPVQRFERIGQPPGVSADHAILGIALELSFEERRCGALGNFCLPGEFVVPDGFKVQAAALRVLMVLVQSGDDFDAGVALLRAALRFLYPDRHPVRRVLRGPFALLAPIWVTGGVVPLAWL